MKWIGQHIYDYVATFRQAVTMDSTLAITGNTTLSGTLAFDSVTLSRIQTSSESFADNDTSIMTSAAIADKVEAYGYSTTTGDITGVTFTTDDTEVAADTAGSADFTITGGEGIDTTGDGGSTINIAGELATTSNKGVASFATADFSVSSGAVSLKERATFDIRGYGTSDGTNYEIPAAVTDNQAPFEHAVNTGSDGLDAKAVNVLLRATGVVMPYAGTLKKWKGWSTHSTTSGTVNIALFKFTPNPSSASTVSLVLLDEVSHTPAGNNTVIDIEETSFTDADVAEGDIIISGIKGSATQITYFVTTLEVEWD